MPNLELKFTGSKGREFNDVVYNDKTFGIDHTSYIFEIRPYSSFWRFGLAFSPDRHFEFNPEAGRYVNKNLRFFQVNVGERPSGEWQSPNKLEITTYYIEKAILQTFDNYTSLSPIRLVMYPAPDGNILFQIYYGPKFIVGYSIGIVIPGYRYFRLFAWSDYNEFSIDCSVIENPDFVFEGKGAPLFPTSIGYWVLKVRDRTWDVATFRVGQEVWFTTHDLQSVKRAEYESLLGAKRGDLVVGYADAPYTASVCIMELTREVHTDLGKGEMIGLTILEILTPPIPLTSYQSGISIADQLLDSNPIRWISISEQEFKFMIQQPLGREEADFVPAYTAEGNHVSTVDQLDFADDIDSFAKVICLKSVKPPLAIGLFGNWGSGKSFFIENLSKRIDKLRGSTKNYVKDVVQVNFNSWHYSDANLWASLITEIFDALFKFSKAQGKQEQVDKLSKTLQITTLQREATEAMQKQLKDKQIELEAQQDKQRAKLQDISGLSLLKLILKDPRIQQDLKSFDNDRVERIFVEEQKVDEYLNQVKTSKAKYLYLRANFFSFNGRWVAIIAVAAFIALCSWGVIHLPFLSNLWDTLTGKLAGGVVFLGAILTKLWEAIKPMRKNFDDAYDRLRSLKQTIADRPKQELPELRDIRIELESTKMTLDKLNQQIDEITAELDDIRSGRKLLQFIEERSRDVEYSKQLGLISWIRKDFNRLDELLRKQYELDSEQERKEMNPGDVQLRIDRIILYIDDLDRCSEDIVVRVLEAVNMLLTFELFVVVVGVDPRWLSQSLDKKYPFFHDKSVSSFEYLEKIFQIPFTLKSTNKKGREDLLGYLFMNEIHHYRVLQAKASASRDNNDNTGNIVERSTEAPGSNLSPVGGLGPAAEVERERDGDAHKKIIISDSEFESIKELSGLFGHTPRKIKRFANIYRLIKAHRQYVSILDPRPTLLLLGIIIGYPDSTHDFLTALNDSTQQSTLKDLLKNTGDLKDLYKVVINNLGDGEWINFKLDDIKINLQLVSRFSFRSLSV